MRQSKTGKFFELGGITYVIFDYASLRLAVPFNKAKENPNKVILELKRHFEKQGESSFISIFQRYAKRLNEDVIHKMPTVKQSIHFSFFVTSDPEVKGIMGASSQQNTYTLDENYPEALQISACKIESGYNSDAEKSIRRQVSGIHELAHVLHGGYFCFKEFGQMCEGFAEMVPYYLMDMEQLDEKHHNDILNLKEKDILTLGFLNHCGYFGLGRASQPYTVQDLRTYQSAYLWMMGYIKRVEEKYSCDKFKATEMLLNEFADISHEEWKERSERIAAYVDMSVEDAFAGKTIQMEGKRYIRQVIEDYYQQNNIIMNHSYNQPVEKDPLIMIADKKEALDSLGNIGVLFQNVAPYYLNKDNNNSPLTPDEQKLMGCIEHFRGIYNLTKEDTVRGICNKLDQYSSWDTTLQQKQEGVAWLLGVDKEKIAEIWGKIDSNAQIKNIVVLNARKGKNASL